MCLNDKGSEEIVKVAKIHRDNQVIHCDLTKDEDVRVYDELDTGK